MAIMDIMVIMEIMVIMVIKFLPRDYGYRSPWSASSSSCCILFCFNILIFWYQTMDQYIVIVFLLHPGTRWATACLRRPLKTSWSSASKSIIILDRVEIWRDRRDQKSTRPKEPEVGVQWASRLLWYISYQTKCMTYVSENTINDILDTQVRAWVSHDGWGRGYGDVWDLYGGKPNMHEWPHESDGWVKKTKQ